MGLIDMVATRTWPTARGWWSKLSITQKLAYGQLTFAGAVMGVASIGTAFWVLGVPQNVAWDIVGACAGGVAGFCAKMA
jgi:hypothetical protein